MWNNLWPPLYLPLPECTRQTKELCRVLSVNRRYEGGQEFKFFSSFIFIIISIIFHYIHYYSSEIHLYTFTCYIFYTLANIILTQTCLFHLDYFIQSINSSVLFRFTSTTLFGNAHMCIAIFKSFDLFYLGSVRIHFISQRNYH